VLALLLMTRLPYDRPSLADRLPRPSGLGLSGIYFFVQRRVRRRFAVVPFGTVDQLEPRSTMSTGSGCGARSLPSGRLRRDGRRLFRRAARRMGGVSWPMPRSPGGSSTRSSNCHESLTGRVEVTHLSENSFGSLLPARGYFH
jgi:hypothetical protein